jgi:hypothetical protein
MKARLALIVGALGSSPPAVRGSTTVDGLNPITLGGNLRFGEFAKSSHGFDSSVDNRSGSVRLDFELGSFSPGNLTIPA